MKVQITQKDIDIGKRGNPYCCPAALAITRVIGRRAAVDAEIVVITGIDKFKTPKRLASFVRRFDNQEVVQPIWFTLRGLANTVDEVVSDRERLRSENARLRAERDDLAAKLEAAQAELDELRIKAGVWHRWEEIRDRLEQGTTP